MRLVVAANRAPIRKADSGWVPSVGGLATALMPVLEQQGGVWVSMGEEDGLPERQEYPAQDPKFVVRRVPLTAEELDHYYYGMANKVLWPVSHYMVEHLELDQAFMEDYRSINRRFAEAVLDEYQEGDCVWVQDYHLMLVPAYVRRMRPGATVAHFWHIPWPAMELYRVLPWARELLIGMLGCDLVGFHVEEYVENFLESARVLLGAEVRGNRVFWEGREVRVEAHPIGIDVAFFEQMAETPEMANDAADLRSEIDTEYLIIGVDRLDYTKGILQRLLAFEQLLERHPEFHGRVTFFQIATPSRTEVESYQQLKREVDEAVGRINGAFMRDAWVPVHYRYRTYTQQELCAFYRAADVALITPLRDGMNLVAQEFVAANKRGVLILSELTGAAYLLPEALQVNPFDLRGVTETIQEALVMPQEEKRERMFGLKERVAQLDVHRWAGRFMESLLAGVERA